MCKEFQQQQNNNSNKLNLIVSKTKSEKLPTSNIKILSGLQCKSVIENNIQSQDNLIMLDLSLNYEISKENALYSNFSQEFDFSLFDREFISHHQHSVRTQPFFHELNTASRKYSTINEEQNMNAVWQITLEQQNKNSSQNQQTKKRRSKAKRNEQPRGFKTKNFLPAFKQSHINFLQKILGQEYVNRFSIISELKQKFGVTLKDYENLYKIQQFKPTLQIYFKNKVAFRDLMISRCNQINKGTFQNCIRVLNRAFMKRQFKKIQE